MMRRESQLKAVNSEKQRLKRQKTAIQNRSRTVFPPVRPCGTRNPPRTTRRPENRKKAIRAVLRQLAEAPNQRRNRKNLKNNSHQSKSGRILFDPAGLFSYISKFQWEVKLVKYLTKHIAREREKRQYPLHRPVFRDRRVSGGPDPRGRFYLHGPL